MTTELLGKSNQNNDSVLLLTLTEQGTLLKACRAMTRLSVSRFWLVTHRPITALLVTASPALPSALRVTWMSSFSSGVVLEQSRPMLELRMLMKSAISGLLPQFGVLSQILCTMAEIPRRAFVRWETSVSRGWFSK